MLISQRTLQLIKWWIIYYLPCYKIHSVTIYFNSWYRFSLTVNQNFYKKKKTFLLTFTCYMAKLNMFNITIFLLPSIRFFFYSKILKWIICDLHWHTTVLEKIKVILLLNDRFCWWGCLLHDVWSVYVVLVHFGRNNNCCQAACWKGTSVLRTQCT